jgi:hypothetical protein
MDISDLCREVSSSRMFFATLSAVDVEAAAAVRGRGCPAPGCGGALHWGRYLRKPRGEAVALPEEYAVRHGLCCGTCRRRVSPPSCLFMGRRVYWGWAVLLATAARRRRGGAEAEEVRRHLGVSRRTLLRWLRWFAELFPRSAQWQLLRGLVSAAVRDDELPWSWLSWTARASPSPLRALEHCLRLLATCEHAA